MERQPPSGIDILVVGAGLGGLFTAVELFRQGHSVRVVESKDEIETIGTHRKSLVTTVILTYSQVIF